MSVEKSTDTMKRFSLLCAICLLPISACTTSINNSPSQQTTISATQIIQRAHATAGGDTWVRPKTLMMQGYGIFYQDEKISINDRHDMWRVYPDNKSNAHQADGKVRIDSFRNNQRIFQISFDGNTTYDHNGPLSDQADSDRWQANFGFGVIRFALNDGYQLRRVADDLIDGKKAYNIIVVDPKDGETLFSISQQDYTILRVGFETPRGWHERIYSNFFTKPGVSWNQPGRVRLFYNGIKANEIIWTDFSVNDDIDPALFILP